ncbi:MAG: hypothetical protein AVDCRST_MAG40-2658, partial [uncultured Gemmatimonadaceae bacterium]
VLRGGHGCPRPPDSGDARHRGCRRRGGRATWWLNLRRDERETHYPGRGRRGRARGARRPTARGSAAAR